MANDYNWGNMFDWDNGDGSRGDKKEDGKEVTRPLNTPYYMHGMME